MYAVKFSYKVYLCKIQVLQFISDEQIYYLPVPKVKVHTINSNSLTWMIPMSKNVLQYPTTTITITVSIFDINFVTQ